MALPRYSPSTVALGVASVALTIAGCSSGPKPLTPAESAAATQHAAEAQQQQVQTIQNNPNMTDAQKANSIAILTRPNGMSDRIHHAR